jgi:cysteine desulfuration protein SufE
MSFESKERRFTEQLNQLRDFEEQFTYLIQLGRRFPALDDALRIDAHLLPGCMSRLWFYPELRDGLCHYHMDTDAVLVKGVAALLCALYSVEPPSTVASREPEFLHECGITLHLSPQRLTGLAHLRSAIRTFALLNLPSGDPNLRTAG